MSIFTNLWRGHKEKPKKKSQLRLPEVQPAMAFVQQKIVTEQQKRRRPMSTESYEKMMELLEEVDALKTKEGELKTERTGHLEQIKLSETEVARCDSELSEIRENQSRLRKEMDTLRDVIFKREDEETVAFDNANTPTDGTHSGESEGRRLWSERQRALRKNSVA